jgi:hypothetical protein
VSRPPGTVWARVGLAAAAVALAAGAASVAAGERRDATRGDRGASIRCARLKSTTGYVRGVLDALAAKQDAWGEELLRSPQGLTYQGVARYLHPLLRVGRPAGRGPRHLTNSGVYYLPFGRPESARGASAVQLHVADGSQIVSDVVTGPKLTVTLGARGRERYGACLSRLITPRLVKGYLPILQTTYVDAHGVRYTQESFATRIPQTRALVSFVRLSLNPLHARRRIAYALFRPSVRHLRRVGGQLRQGRRARVLFSRGARFDGRSLVYTVRRRRTVYVAWLEAPRRVRPLRLNRAAYERAKRSLIRYWTHRLATGARLVVPERRVYDAERNLLIQNMLMSWRYSIGNAYERFTWEMPDVAEVMGAYGHPRVERAILLASRRVRSVFPNRAAGERMVATADYVRRFRATPYLARVTPLLERSVQSFARQLDASTTGLLSRERYGADIGTGIYGLHAQALVLQGLRAIASVWASAGYTTQAAEASAVAARLAAGLRAAVTAAERWLPDGSLFVPVALVDGLEKPYDSLSSSKLGAYWNLVMPYALASGFFPPHGAEAVGLLRYMLLHGSRFLGLVRFAPHTGVTNPGYEGPGSDDVYGTNVVRFLADNDQPDQLLLSLYGKLGASMTRNTFVSGEGSAILPVRGQYYRAMHRPPNSANNAFFLEALRLTLVHETTDANGTPQGLELAYATPRAWLAPGGRIGVLGLRTSFGPLWYSLVADAAAIHVYLDVPAGLTGPLRLRLRLPPGQRFGAITLNGTGFGRFAGPETLDLSGLKGHLELVVQRLSA